jgi:hypothetical protein
MLFSAQHCPVPQAQANAQIASFKEISLQYSYEELSVATMLGWMGYVASGKLICFSNREHFCFQEELE